MQTGPLAPLALAIFFTATHANFVFLKSLPLVSNRQSYKILAQEYSMSLDDGQKRWQCKI